MVGQTDIKHAISQFQDATSAVLTVAFVDLSSRMVLVANSKKTQAQEYLDELAQDASRMLDNPAADVLSQSLFGAAQANECWQSDNRGTRMFLRGDISDEALVFVVSRKTDRAAFGQAARRLAAKVWGF